MPGHRCIVLGCTSGYDSCIDKFHFFTVPKDETRLAQWTKAIARKDFIIKPKQVVCELHFQETDILRKKIMIDTNGKVLAEALYKIPRLLERAVPTIFPKYLAKQLKPRKSPNQNQSSEFMEVRTMVKKRKSVLKSSAQVVDSPMKEPRIIRGNHLEKARNSLNEALDLIAKKEQKKAELATENDVLDSDDHDVNKRVKKNETKQEVKDSLVLKLRDRSIDLASFTNNTAMYPICRAWIKNDPLSTRLIKGKKSENLERSLKSDNESLIVEDYVYKLPPPISKLEVGLEINQKTPKNFPKDVTTKMDFKTLINSNDAPTVSELLSEHRKRWADVRQEWIKFSNENESRYAMSKSILNSMLNKDNSI